MPLINCEVSLTLTWSANCVITSMEKREATPAQGNNLTVFDNSPTNETFKITQNCMYQQLLYQLKMIINYQSNQKQDLKEELNGRNTDQK